MDRTVGVYDLTRSANERPVERDAGGDGAAVASEKLTAQVLHGKQFFYDAANTRLARDRYMSCASCHNDGGSDGRTWDLTGMGEGLRNTIAARPGRQPWVLPLEQEFRRNPGFRRTDPKPCRRHRLDE